jgi:hypothetical protein
MEMHKECAEYMEGRKNFSPEEPPPLSPAGLEAIYTFYAVVYLREEFGKRLESLNDETLEQQFHLVTLVRKVAGLLEAIRDGKTHPLLDYWNAQRRVASTLRGFSRLEQVSVQRFAVIVARALAARQSRTVAQNLVSYELDRLGAYKGCRPTTVKNWWDKWSSDKEKAEAAQLADDCQHDTGSILAVLKYHARLSRTDLS